MKEGKDVRILTTMRVKLCKDCRYFVESTRTGRNLTNVCCNHSLVITDPVFGEETLPFCKDVRGPTGLSVNPCGPGGKLWQPKEETYLN